MALTGADATTVCTLQLSSVSGFLVVAAFPRYLQPQPLVAGVVEMWAYLYLIYCQALDESLIA